MSETVKDGLHLTLPAGIYLILTLSPGYTAHCRSGEEAVVESLLALGHVDPNCTTVNGSTPLSLTRSSAIKGLLLQYGAVGADFSRDCHLHQAAQSSKPITVIGKKFALLQ